MSTEQEKETPFIQQMMETIVENGWTLTLKPIKYDKVLMTAIGSSKFYGKDDLMTSHETAIPMGDDASDGLMRMFAEMLKLSGRFGVIEMDENGALTDKAREDVKKFSGIKPVADIEG